MAHYALLDKNNIVTQVITGVDENITQIDLDGTEVGGSSEAWENFYGNFFYKNCKRTSYNNNYRKNFASIGYTFDFERDAFIPPQPYNSWVLNEESCLWEPPVNRPEVDFCFWDEETMTWRIGGIE